ncbi:MAG: alpha-L-arabinofuranosidase C-terminal domain-containing protein [Acutalibacteraceae bacterium]
MSFPLHLPLKLTQTFIFRCFAKKAVLPLIWFRFSPNTYKGRKNGLRKDLAETVAAIKPKFLRFPGGCVIEGVDYDSAYNWKYSIGAGDDGLPLEFNATYGDVAARKYSLNLWTDLNATEDPLPCFMSYGLGFYEYFLFAEDMGAVGVPVINCGLHCQARGREPVPMDSPLFEQYVQDMVDLVEFCRGGADTTWGKVRASLGHEEPFELKYICIGNENEGENYYERYEAFLERFMREKASNPELYEGIELIYSSGLSDATHSANYVKSYENAKQWLDSHPEYTVNDYAGATDQHYYNDPSWFLKNVDYYDADNYSRDVSHMTDKSYGGAIGVFVGEYAAKSNRLEAALAEAAYMTGLERNGDIVKMAAYAPLFGNLTATHWSPDLIWYNNSVTTGSINYYVQKLFSTNQGKTLLKSELEGALIPEKDLKGKVGVGTWYTTAEYDNLLVKDNLSGETLAKENFTLGSVKLDWSEPTGGEWKVTGGKLQNTEAWMANTLNGAVTFYGDKDWTNYTYSIDCKKTGGDEGFLIPFAVKDTDNYIFWNIGGWGNTKSALQRIENGVKTWEIPGTITDFTVEEGKTYNVKIEVNGTNIKGYINNVLQFEYEAGSDCNAEAYQVVSIDESGDIIIKLVNVTGSNRSFAIDVISDKTVSSTATVEQLYGTSLDNDNILGAEEDCKIEKFTVDGISEKFNYTVPQYSVTVIRIPQK